jgi:hypothetical protein
LALSKPRIISAPVEVLKESLRQIFFLIGLRAEQIPADEEKGFLIQYIVENYGGHTADEVTLAFKMAIQGALKIEDKKVQCYGIFSPLYFTTIMDAYRDWAREQIKLLPAPVEDRKLKPMEIVDINLIWALKCLNEINKLPVKIELFKNNIENANPVQ